MDGPGDPGPTSALVPVRPGQVPHSNSLQPLASYTIHILNTTFRTLVEGGCYLPLTTAHPFELRAGDWTLRPAHAGYSLWRPVAHRYCYENRLRVGIGEAVVVQSGY